MFEVIVERFFSPPPGGRGYSSERVAGKCETEAEAKIKVASLKNEHTGDFYVSYRKATEKLLEVKEVKTMITAQEAKQLYDESGAEVDQFLKNEVEQKVADAAKGGKRQVFVYMGSVKQFEYLDRTVTPLQKAVADKLKTLGYRVEIKLDGDKYVPRGLADDYGKGPTIQNYGIQISW